MVTEVTVMDRIITTARTTWIQTNSQASARFPKKEIICQRTAQLIIIIHRPAKRLQNIAKLITTLNSRVTLSSMLTVMHRVEDCSVRQSLKKKCFRNILSFFNRWNGFDDPDNCLLDSPSCCCRRTVRNNASFLYKHFQLLFNFTAPTLTRELQLIRYLSWQFLSFSFFALPQLTHKQLSLTLIIIQWGKTIQNLWLTLTRK